MDLSIPQVLAAGVLCWAAAAGAVAEEPAAGKAVPAEQSVTQQEIATLIANLGDASTAKRDAASRRLTELGSQAKPQLGEAIKSEIRPIRVRAQLVLINIERRELGARTKAFLAGDPKVTFPGWKAFRRCAGESDLARRWFVEMWRADSELLEAYAGPPEGLVELLNARLTPFQSGLNISTRFKDAEPSKIAAILLVMGASDAEISDELSMVACRLVNLSMAEALRGEFKEPLRKLIGQFVVRPNYGGASDYMKMKLAERCELKDEQLAIAVRTLKRLRKSQKPRNFWGTSLSTESIMAIGRLGERKHTPLLELLLDHSQTVTQTQANGRRFDIQRRDLALATLARISDQEPQDFGMVRGTKNRPINAGTFYFKTDADRRTGIKRWHTWAKANPLPAAK